MTYTLYRNENDARIKFTVEVEDATSERARVSCTVGRSTQSAVMGRGAALREWQRQRHLGGLTACEMG